MKHYFIINPVAGRVNCYDFVYKQVSEIFDDPDDYVIYTSNCPGDAEKYVKDICSTLKEDTVFYACGGDGTVYEVVNGLANCKYAILGILPTGSCNDFLKTFDEYDFLKINDLVHGKIVPLDLIKVNNRYAVNVADAGFDAKVNYDVCQMVLKYKDAKKAYKKAVIKNIFHFKGEHLKVTADDVLIKDDNVLLMALGNGGYYGGGYNCAPYCDTQDGLLEVVIVDKISLFKFANLVKIYKRGEHLDNRRTMKVITYCKAKHLTVDSDNEICFCLDGESIFDKHFEIDLLKHQTRFVIPNNKK